MSTSRGNDKVHQAVLMKYRISKADYGQVKFSIYLRGMVLNLNVGILGRYCSLEPETTMDMNWQRIEFHPRVLEMYLLQDN